MKALLFAILCAMPVFIYLKDYMKRFLDSTGFTDIMTEEEKKRAATNFSLHRAFIFGMFLFLLAILVSKCSEAQHMLQNL